MNVLEQLIQAGRIGNDEAAEIQAEAEASGTSIEMALEKRGVSMEEMLEMKSDAIGIPVRSLNGERVPYEILKYIPEESARHYKIVPLGVTDGVLAVGAVNPEDLEAVDALNFISAKAGLPYKLFLISEADFNRVIEMYKGLSGEVSQALSDLDTEITTEESEGPAEQKPTASTDANAAPISDTIEEDAPVTKIVATILRYAVQGGASDIHIEHLVDSVRVRFRIDGTLQTNLSLPIKVHPAVVARIKVLSAMRLDEKRKPQDGRFSATIEDRRVDFRVSTFPAYHGEKVVMRILDRDKGINKIEKTGLSDTYIQRVRNGLNQPYGMILISGPTGSGKTTTLRAMLNELDREHKNVVSLEDPVEYDVPGVSQSEVRAEIGYTFANGLRTTLRQDPDIIMVGEIRDKETAELAVQAALTGHLVLSTIHTNNALGVILRLVDMGIDPYLIAPTLRLAISQRLVKSLCEGTGKKVPLEGSIKQMYDEQFADLDQQFKTDFPAFDSVYEKQPTDDCPTGTRGRTGVFEVLPMTKQIEEVVLTNPVEEEIWKIARNDGMITMKEDAMLKAVAGTIPFEEVNALGGELLAAEGEIDATDMEQMNATQMASDAAPEAAEAAPINESENV